MKEKLKNLPIKKKLLMSHGLIILLSIIVVITLIIGNGKMNSYVKGLYEGPLVNVEGIADVRYGLTDLQRAINRLLAEKESMVENYPTFEETVDTDVELVVNAVESLKSTLLSAEGKEKLEEMAAKIDEGETVRPKVMEYMKSGDYENAYTLNYGTYLPIVNEIRALSDELELNIYSVADTYYKGSISSGIVLLIVAVVLTIIGVSLALYSTVAVTKSIAGPLEQVALAATRMKEGDMGAGENITYESADEVGVVAASLKIAMHTLKDYIEEISLNLREIAKGDLTKDSGEITDFLGDFEEIKESFVYILKRFNTTLSGIQEAVDEVDSSAGDIAGAAQQLADGTTDQASAIEELTATVETVTNLSENSAKTSQEAYNTISQSVKEAEKEKELVEELTLEMRRITDISKQIESIITTIEDIASQTNLLSLNASIEAARAGEAGRGFAIVADQIGKLATDSAQSAVNTRELIVKTLEEIEKGNTITASTTEAFNKLIGELERFAEVAKSTNEFAKEQATALEEIDHGIEQISAVVQNTASAAEESSAISDQLSSKATEVNGLVKRFKLYN